MVLRWRKIFEGRRTREEDQTRNAVQTSARERKGAGREWKVRAKAEPGNGDLHLGVVGEKGVSGRKEGYEEGRG